MVQRHLSIKKEDILFIATRHYQNKNFDNNKILDFTEFDLKFRSMYSKKESSCWVNKIDNLLDQSTLNSAFTFYVSTVGNTFKQIIASHQRCTNVEIIEEGIIAYMDRPDYYNPSDEKLSFISKLWLDTIKPIIISKRRAKLTSTYDMTRYNNSYFFGFFEGCYPRISDKKRITFNGFYKSQDQTNLKLKKETVIIMDAVAVEQQKYCSVSEFLKIFEQMLKAESANIKNEVYIKFHPSQDPEIENGVQKLLQRYTNRTNIIPINIAFEEILVHSETLNVIGYFSSLLFYAHKMNHKSSSYMRDFGHFENGKNWIESYPIEFLKEICKN